MKKISLALGGGGARGFAHIGVLKVLEEYEIPINAISGTSMGSVIGALYAIGYTPKQIEKLATETDWRRLLDFTIPKKGMLKGDRIENLLRFILKNKKFSQTRFPLYITAANLKNGEKVVFEKGDLTKAVRASISIPLIFEPLEINGKILVDGGLLEPVPIKTLTEKKIRYIVGVKVDDFFLSNKAPKSSFIEQARSEFLISEKNKIIQNYGKNKPIVPFLVNLFINEKKINKKIQQNKYKIPDSFKYYTTAIKIMQTNLSERDIKEADVQIIPKIKTHTLYSFNEVHKIIRSGELETKKAIKKIKRLIK